MTWKFSSSLMRFQGWYSLVNPALGLPQHLRTRKGPTPGDLYLFTCHLKVLAPGKCPGALVAPAFPTTLRQCLAPLLQLELGLRAGRSPEVTQHSQWQDQTWPSCLPIQGSSWSPRCSWTPWGLGRAGRMGQSRKCSHGLQRHKLAGRHVAESETCSFT